MDIVALVYSGTNHSFYAANLVEKHQLTVNLDTSMVIMLADGSQVETCETCFMIIFTYSLSNKPVCYMI